MLHDTFVIISEVSQNTAYNTSNVSSLMFPRHCSQPNEIVIG